MGNEDWVACMGLTFFCNSMVEELYGLRKTGKVSKKLAENCWQAIKEFKGFYSFRGKGYQLCALESKLFDKLANLDTLERFLKDTQKTLDEQFIDEMIRDLEYIIQDNPLPRKLETSAKLQSFFDTLGNYSYYDTRDYLRGASSRDRMTLVS